LNHSITGLIKENYELKSELNQLKSASLKAAETLSNPFKKDSQKSE
jgi:hypothetical protein